MKCAVQCVKFACIAMLSVACMLSCRKNEGTPEEPEPPINQGDSINADTISNHLQFMGASKKQMTVSGAWYLFA
jgi:hypothetical protein